DHRPPARLRGLQAFIEPADTRGAVVGPLAIGVGMVYVETEARARAGRRPLEHLQVAVRVAEGRDRPSPDGGLDADGLPRPVVDEVDLGPLDEHRAAFAGFERHLNSRADDLFGWNAVDPFG